MLRGLDSLRQGLTAILRKTSLAASSCAATKRIGCSTSCEHGRTFLTQVAQPSGRFAKPETKSRAKSSIAETIPSGPPITKRRKKETAVAEDVGTLQHAEPQDLPKSRSKRSRKATGKDSVPPRIKMVKTPPHHNLATYRQCLADKGEDYRAPAYKGVDYEYVTQEFLSPYGFQLQRRGQAGDCGIDHVGYWVLPGRSLKVIIQCKNTKPKPVMIRELAGSFAGAPADWTGNGTLAFLVTPHPMTRGMRSGLDLSDRPLCHMQISQEGTVEGFTWNDLAKRAGLDMLSTGPTYKRTPDIPGGGVEKAVALYWKGKPLKMRKEKPKETYLHSLLPTEQVSEPALASLAL